MKINGLILAAGNSSRLGQPKQLLQHQGVSLLRLIEKKISPQVDTVFSVLGFKSEQMVKELRNSTPVHNSNWAAGIGASIRLGIAKAGNDADAILVALCDQPQISTEHYVALVKAAKKHPKKIIASAYDGINGVPVVFPQRFFDQMRDISDQHGAQVLIQKNHKHLKSIQCHAAAFDVDTPEDLYRLD